MRGPHPHPHPPRPPHAQWDDDAILAAKADLMQQFRDPGRTMLGEVQLEDVKQAVAQSGGRPG